MDVSMFFPPTYNHGITSRAFTKGPISRSVCLRQMRVAMLLPAVTGVTCLLSAEPARMRRVEKMLDGRRGQVYWLQASSVCGCS